MSKLKFEKLTATYWDKFVFDPLHFVCQGSLFSNNENPLLPHESYLYLIETYQNGGIVPLAECYWGGIKDRKKSYACQALQLFPCAYAFYMGFVKSDPTGKTFVDAGFNKWIGSKAQDLTKNPIHFLRLMLDCAENIKRLEREFCPYTALHLRQEFSFYMYFCSNKWVLGLKNAINELQQNPFSDAMKLPYLNDAIRWLMSLNVDDMIAATTAGEYQPDPSTPEDNAQTGKTTFIK